MIRIHEALDLVKEKLGPEVFNSIQSYIEELERDIDELELESNWDDSRTKKQSKDWQ